MTHLLTALCVGATCPFPVASQGFEFSDGDPVASAERFGAEFSRPDSTPELPWRWEEPAGSAARVCVDVTRDSGMTVRSGEIIIGTRFSRLQAGEPHKIWWKPLDSSLTMSIEVVSRSLDGAQEVEFHIAPPTSPFTNDSPPRPIPEEAFFPGGATFPVAGRWVVVATSGTNWGCFIFNVPDSPPAR